MTINDFRTYLLIIFPKLEADFPIISDSNHLSNCISYTLGYITFKVWPSVEGVGLFKLMML